MATFIMAMTINPNAKKLHPDLSTQVSDSLDVEKIQATLENGLLRVHLPKHERVKPREIPVELS